MSETNALPSTAEAIASLKPEHFTIDASREIARAKEEIGASVDEPAQDVVDDFDDEERAEEQESPVEPDEEMDELEEADDEDEDDEPGEGEDVDDDEEGEGEEEGEEEKPRKESRNQRYKRQRNEAREQVEKLESAVSDIESLHAEAEAENDTLRQGITVYTGEVQQLEAIVGALQQQLEEATGERRDYLSTYKHQRQARLLQLENDTLRKQGESRTKQGETRKAREQAQAYVKQAHEIADKAGIPVKKLVRFALAEGKEANLEEAAKELAEIYGPPKKKKSPPPKRRVKGRRKTRTSNTSTRSNMTDHELAVAILTGKS